MRRKTVLVVAYIVVVVVAFLAYALFYNYSYSKYEEWVATQEAKWIARGDFNLTIWNRYVHHDFLTTVWGKNVISVGFALTLGSAIGAIALFAISQVQNERRTQEKKDN